MMTILNSRFSTGENHTFRPDENLIPAPSDPAQWEAFRRDLQQWRDTIRKQLNYDDSLYRRSDFQWIQSCFSCCLLMMYDSLFYDRHSGRYQVESLLQHGREDFGGFDCVVLWQAYPRIGLDDRNQFDFYRDMPGGLSGLRSVVEQFHQAGVKVTIDWNPWDNGTRRESHSDIDALMQLIEAIDADGIFLDTLTQGSSEFRQKLDAVKPGVVLESELALALENIHDHHMSWAQWFHDSPAPGILRNKWFERRHTMHQIDRWNRDHTAELHTAWMNGSGMMVWENVFGSWVGWNQRDKSIYRCMVPIQRRFAEWFSHGEWTPLVETRHSSVFATLWEKDQIRLWALVNRSDQPITGKLLIVPHRENNRYFDLLQGTHSCGELQHNNAITLSGNIPARGVAAFLAANPNKLGGDFDSFLHVQRQLFSRFHPDPSFPERRTELIPIARTVKNPKDVEGMVEIPAAAFQLNVTFRNRECGFYDSSHSLLSKPGEPILHDFITWTRDVTIAPLAMDITPVTNKQFQEFLIASSYTPKHTHKFLHHWSDGRPPSGKEDHPVVYVDLDDARAYAAWAGKRLPTEEEWQYAAQGTERFKYPWGNEMTPHCCNGGETGDTTPVTAFPNGRSPFGIYDLCGNVWEWTESERHDGRTRFCILRGGSYYKAEGSQWYMDGGPQPNDFACKFLLMWPGLDRCATIGFRCVKDI